MRKAMWWAVAGFAGCLACSTSVMAGLIITLVTAGIGALGG